MDKRNMLAIIDFRPPHGDSFLQRDIINDFKSSNKINQFDVNEILCRIEPEKRVQIAKIALDRWDRLKTVTSALIDDEKTELRKNGIKFEDGTSDLEKYIQDIKENFETLHSALQQKI